MVLHEGGNYQDMISPDFEKPAPNPQSTVEAAPMVKPGWIHAHPFLATTIGIGGLLVLGAVLVIQRSDVNPSASSGAWGGAGGFFAGTIRNMNPNRITPSDVIRLQSSQESYAVTPLFAPSADGTPSAAADGIAEILAQLVQATPFSADVRGDPAVPESYSFIPQGLVSAQPQTKARTETQQKLFDYGNDVGSYVKSYEDMHYGSTQILKDHIEDRTNPDKINAVKRIGLDMQQFGIELRNITPIPSEAAGMHKEYANAYIRAGLELVKVAETTTDEEFVNAITVYNTSVEKLTNQFLLLVALFGTNEVTFSSTDPGNIFMFNPGLSLLQ